MVPGQIGTSSRALSRTLRAARRWAVDRTTADHAWATTMARVLQAGAYPTLVAAILAFASGSRAVGAALAVTSFVLAVSTPVVDRRIAIRRKIAEKYPQNLALIVAFLTERIGEAEAATLGEGAPVHGALTRLEAHRAEATALVRAFEQQGAQAMHAEAAVLHDAIDEKLSELRRHRDALGGFFAAVRGQLADLLREDSAASLEVRLARLRVGAAEGAAEADRIIAENIERVRSTIDGAQRELQAMVEESGIAAAAKLPSSGDASADFAHIDAVVTSYLERAARLDFTKMLEGAQALPGGGI